MTTLPDTTMRLLRAVKNSRDSSGKPTGMVNQVIIDSEMRDGIIYLPAKSRYTSPEIVREGIGDLVSLFVFETSRYKVLRHFRDGVYDVSGNEIKVLK